MVPAQKDFLPDGRRKMFSKRGIHVTARYRFGLDSAGEEDVPSDVHFDLFETRREKMDTRSSSTRHGKLSGAKDSFGGREKGIHSFGN